MIKIQPKTPKSMVFHLIRYHDVELSEAFVHRCPAELDLTDLSAFFHQTLAQYEFETGGMRASLDPCLPLEFWLQRFERDILPVLRQCRFPPQSAKDARPLYEVHNH